MNLTKSELDLVAEINETKRDKGKGLIWMVALAIGYLALRYSGVISLQDISVDLIVIVLMWSYILQTFVYPSKDDRYKALLERYVNDDPEALMALARRARLMRRA